MLREQQQLEPPASNQDQLTAVDVFSTFHDTHHNLLSQRTDRYRQLLPATPPIAGQQYAFEVDLDRCSGCKACVTACHSLNGLDENETWRDVGLLIGGTSLLPVMQHVTAACHHCLQPACLAACPVNAYEKDPLTGIVKHLDDQCFGCQYCTLACPYDVPKYHPGKGIVRKCDMCSSRLAVGEAPACVQACPHQAISIKTVDIRQIVEDLEAANFLPAAPDPQISLPTTTYKTKKPFPRNLLPADYFRVNRQHTHWPLVVMLVLTQLSVGAFIVGVVLDAAFDERLAATLRPLLAANALGFGLLAITASVFHLGRPFYAFRAVLGLRHSWLSREIVAFGLFAGLASAYAATVFVASHSATIAPDCCIERNSHPRLECRDGRRRGGFLLDHDLCFHAARMLELPPRGATFCVDVGVAWHGRGMAHNTWINFCASVDGIDGADPSPRRVALPIVDDVRRCQTIVGGRRVSPSVLAANDAA